MTLGGGNKGIKIWCGGGEFNGGDFIIDIIHTLYICIYERTSSTGFFIQWRSFVYIIYIMFPSGHLTSARFACQRYICYIFSRVCSVSVMQYIYDVMNMFDQVQWWRSISVSFETVSLNILVHDVFQT